MDQRSWPRCLEIFPFEGCEDWMVFPLWLLFLRSGICTCAKWRDVRSGMVCKLEIHSLFPDVWNLYDTSETFGFVGADSAV